MAATINADNGSVSGSAGLKYSADSSGVLALQSNGTTALTTSGANVTIAGTLTTAAQSIAKASLPTGSVLQVVQATYTTATSTTSTSFVTTGLSASITPSSSTSKILVLMNMGDVASQNSGAGVNAAGFTLYKNGSNLTSNLGSQISYNSISASGLTIVGFSSAYLDSPATTSSTTYAVFFKSAGAASTVTVFRDNTLGVITLMEIAA